ncbi:MAG: TIM barrel protein [Lentisphaerae bacterium]|nr:TIM barrel protein [Lentisphaerota bacterium]
MLKLCPLIDLFFTEEKCWKARAEQIAACGFSAVETWKGENADELKQMVAGGVKLASIVMNFATEAEVAPCNPKNRAAFIERIEKYATNALEAGCHSGIVTTGQQVGGLSYAAQRAAVVEALAAAADKLAGMDFALNLEPLNTEVDHSGYLLSSSLDSVAIVREIGNAKIKVLYDFYHMTIMGGNQTEFLRQLERHRALPCCRRARTPRTGQWRTELSFCACRTRPPGLQRLYRPGIYASVAVCALAARDKSLFLLESALIFVLLLPNFFFFVKDFSEKKAPSHWHISVSSFDCGAFTRHCLWGISHPRLKPGVKHG